MKNYALYAFALIAFVCQPALAVEKGKLPVVVESRKLSYDDKRKIATYIGNVVAQNGTTVMKGDKMFVYFDATGKYVTKIEITGNVYIKDPRGEGWCSKLTYYPAEDKVILRGNARLKQKKNIIVGDKIVAYKDGRVKVEGIEHRVKTVIYPGEEGEPFSRP